MDTRSSRFRSNTSHELQRNTCGTEWLMQQMRRMSHELNVQKNIFDHEVKRINRRRLTSCDRHLYKFLSTRYENLQCIESRLSLILDRLKKRLSLLRSRDTPERFESSSRRVLSSTDTERREVIIIHRQEGNMISLFILFFVLIGQIRVSDDSTEDIARCKQKQIVQRSSTATNYKRRSFTKNPSMEELNSPIEGEGIIRSSEQAEIIEGQGQEIVAGTSQEGQRSHSQEKSIDSETSSKNHSRMSMENNFRPEESEHPRENSVPRESHTEKKSAKEFKEKTATASESSQPKSKHNSQHNSHSREEPRSREEEREQSHSVNRPRSLQVSGPSYRSYQGRSRNYSNMGHERILERPRNWNTDRDRRSMGSSLDYYNRHRNVVFVPVNYEENFPMGWNPGYDLNYTPPNYGPEIWYPPQYIRGIMPRAIRGPNRRFHRLPSRAL